MSCEDTGKRWPSLSSSSSISSCLLRCYPLRFDSLFFEFSVRLLSISLVYCQFHTAWSPKAHFLLAVLTIVFLLLHPGGGLPSILNNCECTLNWVTLFIFSTTTGLQSDLLQWGPNPSCEIHLLWVLSLSSRVGVLYDILYSFREHPLLELTIFYFKLPFSN